MKTVAGVFLSKNVCRFYNAKKISNTKFRSKKQELTDVSEATEVEFEVTLTYELPRN